MLVSELMWSDEAWESYEHIAASDQVRCEALDRWLDRIEDDPTDPELKIHSHAPHGYLIDVTVPGRDDTSLIVWKVGAAGRPWILHVGKSRP
jgi:hypothetical protein